MRKDKGNAQRIAIRKANCKFFNSQTHVVKNHVWCNYAGLSNSTCVNINRLVYFMLDHQILFLPVLWELSLVANPDHSTDSGDPQLLPPKASYVFNSSRVPRATWHLWLSTLPSRLQYWAMSGTIFSRKHTIECNHEWTHSSANHIRGRVIFASDLIQRRRVPAGVQFNSIN